MFDQPEDIDAETMLVQVPETVTDTVEASTPPEGLPRKFWDETAGAVRMEAMIKSYGDLERKLGGRTEPDIPETPDDYNIDTDDLALEADPEINARLHQAGFTREQAELVYRLAHEKLMPALAGMAEEYEVEGQVEQLKAHFGGTEQWRETSRQLRAWGEANLPTEALEALSGTRDGILTLHRMMVSSEPGIGPGGGDGVGDDERKVKGLMNDPRYWRDRDPAMVEKVRRGFRKLYPEG